MKIPKARQVALNSHQNNFNLLRLVFASLVIVSHVPELQTGDRSAELLTRMFGTLSFGEFAVDGFFILSGYLIVKSWCVRPSFLNFLINRVLRIFPGFIVAATICVFVIGPIYGGADYFSNLDVRLFSTGVAQLRIWGVPSVFQGSPYPDINGAMWTIPYEFKCYMLVMVFGISGLFKWRVAWLTLFLVSTIGFIFVGHDLILTPYDRYFRLIMVFAAGGCFYLYRDLLEWNARTAVVAFCLFLAFMPIHVFAEVGLGIFFGYAVIFIAVSVGNLFGFNRLPDVSYGVYLYAWPINKILLWHWPQIDLLVGIFVTFLLSIAAGVVSWYAVEKPFMDLKGRG